MVPLSRIHNLLSRLYPPGLAESWDPIGLQIGHPDQPVTRIGFALDATSELVARAAALGIDLLVVHHPLFFSPLKSLDLSTPKGRIIDTAIRSRMGIIAAHTNLDSAAGGLNDHLADLLGLVERAVLGEPKSGDAIEGLGRVGRLPEPEPMDGFLGRVKDALGLSGVRVVGQCKQVCTVALCTGSGASLLGDVVRSGADVYLTGDMKYHEAMDALDMGLCVVDADHWGTERIVVDLLTRTVGEAMAAEGVEGVEIVPLPGVPSPFRYA